MKKIGHFLTLARPANIVTAIADILAGVAIALSLSSQVTSLQIIDICLLIASTIGLYGGGIVFNDIFDLQTDKIERPERILPSGKLSLEEAMLFGSLLFSFAICFAFIASSTSGVIAICIMLLALSYDKLTKRHQVIGPLNMGLCRSFNLLLGISIIPSALNQFWFLGFIPLAYIAAITLVAQKENTGKNKNSILYAIFLDTAVMITLLIIVYYHSTTFWTSLPFIIFWFGINLIAKSNAYQKNNPEKIKKAVKIGVISIIPLNAIYVAGFMDWTYGFLLIGLLPISFLLAKKFAVT
ncbi:UbiA-like protein EboC [Aureibacter tunicatorum]|uniref:4-hydroxybenzoate polyprenyltransferase n=1 Tax=Aureibacter tunicatorum TaxID=866807 RepID=A0AAE3XR96_9BACT|nr:UbiA-like protein EboC [Aureibacter tunicatorum]MDR6240593.1 4-hydroxybenzoate polyprenyltransferase [Aureibacter tunicatorum]BDD06546.1 hypothetical protein AUTU_40290 [Aureibacter tunicatorum]